MTENTYRELLLGAGCDHRKRYCAAPHHPRGWQSVNGKPVTLDVNKACKPDLWADLNSHGDWFASHRADPDYEGFAYPVLRRMEDDTWDEIHAYEVLEHLGSQGDFTAFFHQFTQIWRILKPNGYLVAEVPSRFSGHLWGDPGHRRAIVAETLPFLDQSQYILQCDGPEATRTPMSDYRGTYKADFKTVDQHDNRNNFIFVLQAVKPTRWVGRT
jgi:hypothetical protein